MARVLYVEDNDDNVYMLTRRLARRGHQVSVAPDGESGIEQARAEQPDIILMDMGLPGIDGWEATRRLKADGDTAAIPVIALTAHAMEGDREKGLAAGCNEFETKPVQFDQLVAKIIALLGADDGERPAS
jgi:two-component system cell cycle response regulator DivK